MSLSITFEKGDVFALGGSVSTVDPYRSPHRELADQFTCEDEYGLAGQLVDPTGTVTLLLAHPNFDNGALIWCDNNLNALLVMKILRAAGEEAYVLTNLNYDPKESEALRAMDFNDRYAVLTSWNLWAECTSPHKMA